MTPVELVHRFYAAYNEHDLDTMRDCYSEWGSFVAPGGVTMRGRDHAANFDRRWLIAFPDLAIDLRRVEAAGDAVVVEASASGTHTGALRLLGQEVPATNRVIELAFCVVYAIEDDVFASAHLQYDRLDLLRQLGRVPEQLET